MFTDFTAPRYCKGDMIKIKRKSIPFKITEVLEDEQGKIIYLVKAQIEFIIDEDQIQYQIQA